MATKIRSMASENTKHVVGGLAFILLFFLLLRFGLPDNYRMLCHGNETAMIYEMLSIYLAAGIFFIFMARYFLLFDKASLFFGLAFLAICFNGMVCNFLISVLAGGSRTLEEIRDAITISTQSLFIVNFLMGAFVIGEKTPLKEIAHEARTFFSVNFIVIAGITVVNFFFSQ